MNWERTIGRLTIYAARAMVAGGALTATRFIIDSLLSTTQTPPNLLVAIFVNASCGYYLGLLAKR